MANILGKYNLVKFIPKTIGNLNRPIFMEKKNSYQRSASSIQHTHTHTHTPPLPPPHHHCHHRSTAFPKEILSNNQRPETRAEKKNKNIQIFLQSKTKIVT